MPPVFFGADPATGNRLTELISLWPMWLPVVLGGIAIYGLLPRPRPTNIRLSALVGLVALVAAGVLLVQVPSIFPEAVLFYSFSALTLLGGGLLVTQANPARAALSFVVVVLSTSGLFLLLAAPFLMAATIVVYAGAIIVTFLFVLMLAQQAGLSDADARSREPVLATVTGFVLLFAILYVLRGYQNGKEIDRLIVQTQSALAKDTYEEIKGIVEPGDVEQNGGLFSQSTSDLVRRFGLMDVVPLVEQASFSWEGARPMGDQKADVAQARAALKEMQTALATARDRLMSPRMPALQRPAERPFGEPIRIADGPLPLSKLSGIAPNTPPGEIRRNPQTLLPEVPAENSAYLGRSLFTDYLLSVEIGGLLLLIATVGAIAISQRRSEAEKKTLAAFINEGPAGRGR